MQINKIISLNCCFVKHNLVSKFSCSNMSEKHLQPKFSQSQVVELMKRLYRLTPLEIYSLPSYEDQNFHVAASEGGYPTQTALPTIFGQLMSLEELDYGYGCQKYLVRLLTYLTGTMVCKVSVTSQLLYETGKMAAQMDTILQKLEHPYLSMLQRDNFIWHLSRIPMLEAYINFFDGDPLQEVVKSVIHQFNTSVIPKLSYFRKCLNHSDLNQMNILVQPNESDGHRISGILDFCDMNSGCFIYELAITIMNMMLEHQNPIEVGGHVLAGWESVLPLNKPEKDCLYVLVLSRLCQSVVLVNYEIIQNPENKEYFMFTRKNDAQILSQLWELGSKHVEKIWFQTAAGWTEEDKHQGKVI
ncbi:hydroxylysine kinase-like isoform X3 [Antennarius striatus]|uniref:hydroxylysine kinase-like isoform X3 n=1 Tax=Antennarius striatus TaxID=241820 RepID=UPI0035B39C4D